MPGAVGSLLETRLSLQHRPAEHAVVGGAQQWSVPALIVHPRLEGQTVAFRRREAGARR